MKGRPKAQRDLLMKDSLFSKIHNLGHILSWRRHRQQLWIDGSTVLSYFCTIAFMLYLLRILASLRMTSTNPTVQPISICMCQHLVISCLVRPMLACTLARHLNRESKHPPIIAVAIWRPCRRSLRNNNILDS